MIELKNKDTLEKFKEWLINTGVDVQEPKIWELLRFKVEKDVGIIYHNKYGSITTATPYAKEAWEHFSTNRAWYPVSSRRKQLSRVKHRLYEMYGGECFYCGVVFELPDLTLEHLLSLSHGGKNNHHNYVLSCEPHNTLAGSKPLLEKIKLRDKLRGYV